MKADTSHLRGGFGEIVLFPESVDDVWHLSHIVVPGDLVYATTFRAPESSADKIRPEKLEKRLVRLGIRVEKVEFHRYSVRLRISGRSGISRPFSGIRLIRPRQRNCGPISCT